MRAANLLFLILVLLVALASNAPTATASFLTASPSLHRHLLHKRTASHTRRHLLQSCSSCPAASTASATCSAASASQLNTIRAELISKCSSTAFNSNQCCELYSSSNWNTISACACSDTIAGLSAFVDGSTVMAACGCGPSSGSSSGTSFTTTGPNLIGRVSSSNDSRSTSSSIDMAAVYSAVTFSNNDNGNSGGGSSPPSGGGSSTSGTGGGTGSKTPP